MNERILNVNYFDGYTLHNTYNCNGQLSAPKTIYSRDEAVSDQNDEEESRFYDIMKHGIADSDDRDMVRDFIRRKKENNEDDDDFYYEDVAAKVDEEFEWDKPIIADIFDFSDPLQIWPLFDLWYDPNENSDEF